MSECDKALAAWEQVRLAEKVSLADQQGLKIADQREEAVAGREVLKDVIRAFKATPQAERVEKIGGVVKAFQAEVDALTRRQTFAEGAFLDLYRSLDEAPDHKGRDHEGRDAAGQLVVRRCMFDWPIFLKLLTGHTKTMHVHDAMTSDAFYERVRIKSGLDEPRGIGAAT